MKVKLASYSDLPMAVEFLRNHEYSCVSLMSRLLTCLIEKKIRSQSIYLIKQGNDEIFGVFTITLSGILLHHILPCVTDTNLLKPLLKDKNLFSLAGTKAGSDLLESALRKKPTQINDYYTMTLKRDQNVTLKIKKLNPKFKLIKCSIEDEKKLYSLQKAYQIEEVLPSGKKLTETACKSIIKDRLSNHIVFAITDLKINKLVSMGGTNAEGIEFVQLGGIYTDTDYRNLGLAQNLVYALISNIDKNISLFVRISNEAAIKAYSKVGFTIKEPYRICYM